MIDLCDELLRLIAVEHVDPHIFVSGLRWWIALRDRHDRLPRRTDFRPEEMPVEALPHVLLIDVGPTPDAMRFRLVGTAHVQFNQHDYTGKKFSEIYDKNSASLPYIMGLYAELRHSRRPIWTANAVNHPKTKELLKICRLMLPFANHDNDVSLCLAVQQNFYTDKLREDSNTLWPTAKETKERSRVIL